MSESFLPNTVGAIDAPIAFVDLETTGGSVGEHRITEIGVVEVVNGEVSRWSTLVDPQQPIPPFIQQLTGITDRMVRGQPTFEQVAPALFERLGGKLFVAHNASFDRGFLGAEFERIGFQFRPDVLCTVRLSRALFPAEKRHGLDALVERHALVPQDRHRALADADLLWQFWQRLHAIVPLDTLRAQIDRMTRRHRIAGDITDDLLDTAPAGHGVYAFYGEGDAALYVGRSVRVRQRVRAHLSGDRRSARELRLAQQVRRVEWRETGGELGAFLLEAQWIAALRPTFNRQPRVSRSDPTSAPWPFDGAVLVEEIDGATAARHFHAIDGWCYLGQAGTAAEAAALADRHAERPFELSTYRILRTHLARGLQVRPVMRAVPEGAAITTAA
ncbi:exonuclease domain-containing protein [Paraburkholderia caballeronis]|uniref:exonuclease domain-containing protein n=1 Tax=Paraburkholderia caballeronis TaxID=416943 RepID=UPI0010664310|nr:exonuclease domain-containing protein [Paraburkholderia caballeronis]TDV02951.1 DNA polymerase-3 subunit epsilon [Paraburkholderia caballeronis]TDV06893.1 DNA polymerase-3 subunit epsilon [Paraburkholderia caballeronis]TDV17033.1 DNA polymerase-3 subunit epsilon [Paraburkholderia caballeronis]